MYNRKILFAIAIFFLVVIVGSVVLGAIEHWSFTDAFYMVMSAATTTGYGDFVPRTTSGKMFISFYSLLGIGFFLYLFELLIKG